MSITINSIIQAWGPTAESAPAEDQRMQQITAKLIKASHSPSKTVSIYRKHFEHIELSKELTLGDLRKIHQTSQMVEALVISYLGLKLPYDLFEKITGVAECVLDEVTLYHVQDEVDENSQVWFAISSELEFLERSLSSMKEVCFTSNVALKRLKEIELERPKKLKMRIRDLRFYSSKQLNKMSKKLPASAFRLLLDEQIEGLDFSLLTACQIDQMISRKELLDQLSEKQLYAWIENSSLLSKDLVTPELIEKLDFERITPESIGHLFRFGTRKELIHSIPLDKINYVAQKSPKILRKISDQQLQEIDVASLSQDAVWQLFPGFTQSTLAPGETYKMETNSQGTVNYVNHGRNGTISMSKDTFSSRIEEKRTRCLEIASKLSEDQLEEITLMMHPEVQALIREHQEESQKKHSPPPAPLENEETPPALPKEKEELESSEEMNSLEEIASNLCQIM